MSSLAAEDLRCEALDDPEGIDARVPRLSWSLRAPEAEARDVHQSAYHVLVASDPAHLSAEQGDLWDSGWIDSSQTMHVRYDGAPLASRQRCWWKVRVRDQGGAASAWSGTAYWSMGLLAAADWHAAWIGEHEPEAWSDLAAFAPPMLRRQFTLAAPIDRAVLYVSALGLYEATINGQRVGDRCLAPEWTDYRQRVQYQTYEVTALLREGANAVGALLGDGWYTGRLGLANIIEGVGLRGLYGKRPRLRLQLECTLRDGQTHRICSDHTWRYTQQGPVRAADLLDGQVHDARRAMPGWDEPGFDDSMWQAAYVDETMAVTMSAQPNEPIRVTQTLQPVSVFEREAGRYVFDLGQNMVGWCRLHTQLPGGRRVRLRHAEVLDAEGELYRDNLRINDDNGAGARQEDHYIAAGQRGGETFEPRFTYHGFRYVEVRGLDEPPDGDALVGQVVHSAADPTLDFACSNPMLTRLMEVIRWTLRGNLHSVPTDCPQRDERLGWMGDAQAFSQSACYLMNMGPFFAKWLRDVREAQTADGRFPDYAPHPYLPWTSLFTGNPGWADAGVLVPWCVWVNYGDRRLLEEHFDAMTRWIACVETANPDLIWRHQFQTLVYGDWLNASTIQGCGFDGNGQYDLPHEVLATAFFARSTALVAQAANVLGREEDARHHEDLARRIRAAFCSAFVDEEAHVHPRLQSAYALALAFDLLPEAQRPAAAAHLAADVRAHDYHPTTGIQTTQRMLEALTRFGHHAEAYRLIKQKTLPSWGYMLAHGATTIWERWDGYVPGREPVDGEPAHTGFQAQGMNSFNHYAVGAVAAWIVRTIGGVAPDPTQPAYKHVRIAPSPDPTDDEPVTWAETTYRSVRGPIHVAWRVARGMFELDVELPPNISATVTLPTDDPDDVRESDTSAYAARGVKQLTHDAAGVHCTIGAGAYRFRAPVSRVYAPATQSNPA